MLDDDNDVPAFWRSLGMPGLADIHVHFLPESVMRKVWAYFDQAEEHYGRAWPVHYRGTDAERVATLTAMGVRTFTGLTYPHRPGMAEWLSQWARQFAAQTPGCVPSGTFFPEPSAPDYVRAAIEAGTKVFKAHVQVGGYDPRDESLRAVWGQLADAGLPVVVHCGSGPIAGRFTGPDVMAEVLREFPSLTLVVAHAGAPEYEQFAALTDRYPNVWLDTTMVGTEYLGSYAPLPAEVIARYRSLGHRIVLGSDFPNIPYPYVTQLEALTRWDVSDDWLRAVCWHNGRHLLGLEPFITD